MQNFPKGKTINGCWNCVYGGNLKILTTLFRSIEFEFGISLTHKVKKELNEKLKPETGHLCSKDCRMQCETGYICEFWSYDGKGYQTKPEASGSIGFD